MYKLTENGYVLAVSATATDGVEITEQEYSAILSTLRNRPEPKEGFALMLKDKTLEWDYFPIEPEPPTEEQQAEALTRYANELARKNDPDLLSCAEPLIK